MDHEKQLLLLKVSALETFMEKVCMVVKCLPSYADPLPNKGNKHVLDRIIALLKTEELVAQSGEAPIQQLEAKIDALISELETDKKRGTQIGYNFVLERLRQLRLLS